MWRSIGVLWLATACAPTDKLPSESDTATETTGPAPGEGTFCEVRTIFTTSCVAGCHSAAARQGELDLETDPFGAVVGVPSATYNGRTLVVAGDAAGSFLMVKLLGEQEATEGTRMPEAVPLPDAQIETVRRWIDGGASGTCDTDTTATGRYHPVGFDDPGQHGLAAKYQEDDCRSCHGEDLTGGTSGVSCDTCHQADWRTTCTYCHGGVDNTTGAPPEDISDEADAAATTFPEHTAHVTETIHGAFDCVQCHTKPEEALTPGHFLVADDTPGVAEVSFALGLSAGARYEGAGSCSNLYCHGKGQGNNGTAHTGSDYSACDSCHADSSDRSGWSGMSGQHERHLNEGVDCSECHPDVTSAESILDPSQHVDGTAEVDLPTGMTQGTNGCTGLCHWQVHYNEDW